MKLLNFFHSFFVLTLFIFLIGCSKEDSTKNIAIENKNIHQEALDKITTYAQDGDNVPTIQDYKVIGISGINSYNINEINQIIEGLSKNDVDTLEEIQFIADNLYIYEKPDYIKPIITFEGNSTITIIQDSNYTEPTITAVDDIDGILKVEKSGNVDTTRLGKYTIIYTATDKANNSTSIVMTVNVIPKTYEQPTISLIGKSPMEVYEYTNFSDPGAKAKGKDNKLLNITTTGFVNTTNKGVYTLTYSATDAYNNTISTTRLVNVIINPNLTLTKVTNVSEFRKALEDASINGKDDIIMLDKGIYKTTEDSIGTFTFDDNENQKLFIMADEGLNAGDVILDGDNTNRVLDFDNNKNGIIYLKNLSITNGKEGGIASEDYLDINSCKIYKNITSDVGAGILAISGINLVNSEVFDNHNTADEKNGGAIYSLEDANITNSKIYNNISTKDGGGVASFGDNLYIRNSKIYNNSSKINGGAIYTKNDLILINSIIHTNSTLQDSNLTNLGTAIYVDKKMILLNNTIANNIDKNETITNSVIYGRGIMNNNILYGNTGGVYFTGYSEVQNNYIDYSKFINGNSYTIIRKNNILPKNEDIVLNNDFTLPLDSIVINEGINPDSSWFGEDYYRKKDLYDTIINQLNTDIVGKDRINDKTIDLGAYEYY